MAGEEREYTAEELASRWLTVEQVLGRRAGWSAGMSADERSGPGWNAGGPCVPAAGEQAPVLRADGRREQDVGGDRPVPAAVVPLDEHRALNVVTAGSYLAAGAPAADVYQHPALDLVAADTDLASRWFTADPAPGRLAGRTVVLPFTALAELATWPERLLWGHSRAEDLSLWTEPGRVIAGDDTVCRIWARITVAAQRAGSALTSEDAWIAAGCLSYGLPLATQHKQRYQYFAARYGLRLL